MWFLIGSQAITILSKDFYRDTSQSDLDLYCSENDFKDFLNNSNNIEKCFPLKKNKYRLKITGYPVIELKVYSTNSVYHWLSLNEQNSLLSTYKYDFNGIEVNLPNLQCLQAIKQSHIYWPIHWLKNIEDLTWLKSNSHIFNCKEKEFQRKIRKEMKSIHGKIPYGKITGIDYQNWISNIEKITTYDSYEKNMVFFIHYQLSLKNKLKVVNNWNNIKNLLKSHHKKLEI